MSRKKVSGIYRIICEDGNGVYIGQAANVLQRIRDHRFALLHNTHKNRHLQNAFNKYGLDTFCFECVEEVPNPTDDLLYEREKYWLEVYVSAGYKAYNIAPIEKANRGMVRTDEQKERARVNTLKQMQQDPTLIRRMADANTKIWPPFEDASGTVYRITNLSQFCKERGIDRGNMAGLFYGKCKTIYGFRLAGSSAQIKERVQHAYAESYTVFSPCGIIHTGVKDLNRFAKDHDLDAQVFRKVCRGRYNSIKGYTVAVEVI